MIPVGWRTISKYYIPHRINRYYQQFISDLMNRLDIAKKNDPVIDSSATSAFTVKFKQGQNSWFNCLNVNSLFYIICISLVTSRKRLFEISFCSRLEIRPLCYTLHLV